ncbi:MAG: hypothetical protein U9Q33_04780 [Campylobacterota bacterium]|nr:hypothetical protein [Campylobacterota bacterium]
MKTSYEKFNYISNYLDLQKTHLKYNKGLNHSKKYIQGKLAAIDFLQALLYHFINKELSLKDEFIKELTKNNDMIEILKSDEYKKGILDTFDETIKKVN